MKSVKVGSGTKTTPRTRPNFHTRSTRMPTTSISFSLTQSSQDRDRPAAKEKEKEKEKESLTMDQLLLYPSDNDTFEGDHHTPEVPETSPSITENIQPFLLPRMRSAIHIPRRSRHSSSNISDIVGPSPSSNPRGRSRLRRPRAIGRSTWPSPTRSTPRCSGNRRSYFSPDSPRQLSDGASAANISDWTVAHLRHTLSQLNIPFHCSDKKLKLFQLLTDPQQHTTLPC